MRTTFKFFNTDASDWDRGEIKKALSVKVTQTRPYNGEGVFGEISLCLIKRLDLASYKPVRS